MYDVIILGSGPAGLTAAIYTTRAGLKTLVIAGSRWGGQLMLTGLVENYPGFPQGIPGAQLMEAMRSQAERFEAKILNIDFKEGDFTKPPFQVAANGEKFEGKAIIIATGVNTRWLGIPGERELIGRGVSSCGTCDAHFFQGKKVIVVGGGDTALDDALMVSKFADSVIVVNRRDALRASKIMQERVFANKKIKILYDTLLLEVLGKEKVTGVKFENAKTGKEGEMAIDGIFVAIGHDPNTNVFKGIELDPHGYILVNNHTKTNIPGVFVAGDVHDAHYKQAITAAGMGCMAALDTERWLNEQK